MKISHNWLSEYVDLTSDWTPARIAQTLTDLGLEVEHIDDRASTLKGFVVGRILTCEKHPKADKLSVTTVDVGDGTIRTIVCGASNVAAGQTVPVALEGAVVPTGGGYTISRRVLRGVESQGMICSKAELGLEPDIDGIWSMADDNNASNTTPGVSQSLAVGTPIADVLGYNDIVYDVAITPNRADALSHIGIARELQAYMHVHEGKPLWQQPTVADVGSNIEQGLHTESQRAPVGVELKDTALCPRYIAQRITGVKAVASPQWMQDRLTAIGLRPRNIIVDATNYVMMEWGQPLHAFDERALTDTNDDSRDLLSIVVQTAADAFAGKPRPWMFTTLDGKQRELDADALLICNASGPVGIAGVMGGENSEIADDTTDIVIESAYFSPSSIRRTAKRVGLNTDASYRFERGVDIEAVATACARATELICKYGGGSASAPVDVYPAPTPTRTILVRYDRMRSINGIDISNEEIDRMCESVGLVQHPQSSGGNSTTAALADKSAPDVPPNISATSTPAVHTNARVWSVPSFRADLLDEIDVAEEVMRLYGVNNIPSATHAHIAFDVAVNTQHNAVINAVRKGLAARGYADCVTHVLGAPNEHQNRSNESQGPLDEQQKQSDAKSTPNGSEVTLKNAMGVEFSALRTSLLPALLQTASMNLRHGAQGVRLVEIGKVFNRDALGEFGLRESQMMCLVVSGLTAMHWSSKQNDLDLYDIEGDLLAALRLAGIHAEYVKTTDVDSTDGDSTDVNSTDASKNSLLYVHRNSLTVMHNNQRVGRIGQVHPLVAKRYDIERSVVAAEIEVMHLVPQTHVFRNMGMFPSMHRDVAFVVGESVAAGAIMDVAKKSGTSLLQQVDVFDVYRDEQIGGGKKSVGISLTFRSDDRTLVDAEVDSAVNSIIHAAANELHAQVRGN